MATIDFQAPAADTGKTARFYVIRPSDGFWWNKALAAGAGDFEAFNAANYTTTKYLIAMTETAGTSRYSGTFPAAVPAGTTVDVVARFDTVVGTPALTDRVAGQDTYDWDGAILAASVAVYGFVGDANDAMLALANAVDGIPAAILLTPANKIKTNASNQVETSNPATGAVNEDETIILEETKIS